MEERSVTEAELHAWLDGELPADRCGAVRRYLAEHPEDARRLESYRRQAALIARAYTSLPEARAHPQRSLRMPVLAGLAALLLAVGAAVGWLGRDLFAHDTGELVASAVSAHRVYVVEVRHPVEVAGDQSEHLATWLSKRLDRPLRIPSLDAAGYKLVGGRLLPAELGAAAQFMYEAADGRRVTLYCRPEERRDETAFRIARSDGVSALTWRGYGLAWALVAELDPDSLMQLAHHVEAGLAPDAGPGG